MALLQNRLAQEEVRGQRDFPHRHLSRLRLVVMPKSIRRSIDGRSHLGMRIAARA